MQGKRRVLVVDDEPKILDGFRRMMHSMRNRWDASFAESGREALDILDAGDFDVIVTDMRMPGMDGIELLEKVMDRYPQVVRIVLSGQINQESLLRSIGLIHQYLSKPCDAEMLRATISHIYILPDLLANDELKRLISRMGSLPSQPSLYRRVMKELRSPDASIRTVGDIISKDMGMVAKILQLTNSTIFDPHQRILSPTQAVAHLGLEMIRTLVFSVRIFSQLEQTALERLSLGALWEHSVSTGELAKRIACAEGCDRQLVSVASTAGLLHDVGKLVLAVTASGGYRSALSLASDEGIELLEAERRIFGSTHAEVGAYLLGLWGLPASIVTAVAFHHNPMESDERTFSPLTAVHLADALERSVCLADAISQLDTVYLGELGLEERLPVWWEICQDAMQRERTDDRENSLCG